MNYGYTYDEIHMQEGILEFADYKQQFKWILACDGINSPIRQLMMKTGLFTYERTDNEFSFVETRVHVPPGCKPDRQHVSFGPDCQLMLTPLREGYEKDPIEL